MIKLSIQLLIYTYQINRLRFTELHLDVSGNVEVVLLQYHTVEAPDLFYSERCGDLLAPEDHGPVGQNLGQLIRIQP